MPFKFNLHRYNAGGDDSESIKELADEFVMVAVSEAEATETDEMKAFFNPGGKHAYVPRVLFASAGNDVLKNANNQHTKGGAGRRPPPPRQTLESAAVSKRIAFHSVIF